MSGSRTFLKIVLFTFYFLLLLAVSGKLFFEKQFDSSVSKIIVAFESEKASVLRIGVSEPLANLNPLANDTGSRERLLNIYEALVRVSPDLQIEPGLAISYGSLNDLTWEFRLRPNVFFHDGSLLTLDDVIYSLNQAKNDPKSGVKDLMSNIKEIQKESDQVLHIMTDFPDPLLLQKLSAVLIFSKNKGKLDAPLGTGPFIPQSNENGTLALTRFNNYWDTPLSSFKNVEIKTFSSKDEKLKALKDNSLDIIANVPTDVAAAPSEYDLGNFSLVKAPTLEVNFLLFHFDKIFKQKALREAVKLALDTEKLSGLAQGFAIPSYQFVGNGIFGYDPTITPSKQDTKKADELVKSVSNFSRLKVTLELPAKLETFGSEVQKQLKKVGVDVELKFLNPAELGKRIMNRQPEFFFFGWRTETGDATDFLTAVAHSPNGNFGQFNGGNYNNPEVDRLIESSLSTVKQSVRMERLRAAMKKITEDDIIGIPLFTPEVIYGVASGIAFRPRTDGYILAREVKI